MSEGVAKPTGILRTKAFELTLLTFWLVVFVYVAIETRGFPNAARIFPQYVSYAGIALVVLSYLRLFLPKLLPSAKPGSGFTGDLPAEPERDGGAAHPLVYLGWAAGYYLTIALIGFFPGTLAFLLAFLKTQPQVTWATALKWTSGVLLMAYGMGLLLQLRWPQGWVQQLLARGF
jgi:hypothetical protein